MKDLLLALTFILQSQIGATECSSWDIYGAGSPKNISGHSANYGQMLEVQRATRAYIKRLERTVDNCKLDKWQKGLLMDAIELAAKKYNRSLATYNETRKLTAKRENGNASN
ncbi:MAG TPA: hypothetical protein DIW43_02555 [Spongiibacteraceae bacterium]|nr:hypothetical protein [Spongiibacteraceae bacterium]HCS26304.1 hypothetical protein [Spongiibacteraceae bacterium]|tara:strand:- start:661 stop:996 length:336 start_codon:yes stop_codon:yes gene_type:complete